jgi:hypothetical protein
MLGIFKSNKQNDLWQFQSHIGIPAKKVKIASGILVAFMAAFTVFADLIHLFSMGVL